MMNDDTTREIETEEDRAFYEEMRGLSDADLLAGMKQLRDGLLAENGKQAHELGLSDEYVEKISADIAKFEKAIREEQLANQHLEEATQKMNAAADRWLNAIDPEYPDIIDGEDKKGH